MRFIGVDLGWSSSPSGLCCLEFEQGALVLRDLRRDTAIADILDWIDRSVPDAGMVAVDAPTLIPNQTGMRLPERGTIEFKNVEMSYRQGLPAVLKGVSFQINPGEKVRTDPSCGAVVGIAVA